MKGVTVTINIKPYLAQWMSHAFGTPAKFPSRSYENALLVRLTEKQQYEGGTRPMTASGNVRIYIPDSAYKRPEFYNYLPPTAQKIMASAIEDLFLLHLWRECFPLLFVRGSLNSGLNAWCAANGISIDYREGIRQRFYRMRANYRRYGINIGEKYKKSLP